MRDDFQSGFLNETGKIRSRSNNLFMTQPEERYEG